MALSNLCDAEVIAMIDGAPKESIACLPPTGRKCLHISEPLTDHSYHTQGNVSQFDLPLHIRREVRYKKISKESDTECKGVRLPLPLSAKSVGGRAGGPSACSSGQRRFVNSVC